MSEYLKEVVSCWDGVDLLKERVGAIGRTGERLDRILSEMRDLEQDLDRIQLTMYLPGLSSEVRHDLIAELELTVDSYNHLREAATRSYRQLILQRESCGFRGHDVVKRCYPIPDMLESLEEYELIEQQ